MFKKSAEQNIIIRADKVVSMKESLDAISWDRVAEIGKLLQRNHSDKERYNLANELIAISQANISLLGKLGIQTASLSGKLMGSGVEVLQGEDTPRPDSMNGAITNKTLPREESSPNGMRSIVHPVEERTRLIPDVLHDTSDFFSTPETQARIQIPRAEVNTEEEKIEHQDEWIDQDVFLEAAFTQDQNNGALQQSSEEPCKEASSGGTLFESVLEFTQKKSEPEKAIDPGVETKDIQTKAICPKGEAKDAHKKGVDRESILAKEFGLDAKTIAELGIEAEVLDVLVEEVCGIAPKNDSSSVPENVWDFDLDLKLPKIDPAVDAKGDTATLKRVEQDVPKSASHTPKNEIDSVQVERFKTETPAFFSSVSKDVNAELDRQVKLAKKKAQRDERVEPEDGAQGKPTKKYRRQDLANFKQIYASRDGSLVLYRDSKGHIVAMDSSKLA